MRKIAVVCVIMLMVGCAKVNLQTTEPLKVDINMRVDVYQHVVKDVESIEDQVYGSSQKQLNLLLHMEEAYAEESQPELAAAIERRKARASQIQEYFDRGIIGENRDALLEIRDESLNPTTKAQIQRILVQENADRDVSYQTAASRNTVDLRTIRKTFFDDHYKRASSGAWFEVYSPGTAKFAWVRK
jgi:uncharacterized protein YdbL (DUF1318 family)